MLALSFYWSFYPVNDASSQLQYLFRTWAAEGAEKSSASDVHMYVHGQAFGPQCLRRA